MSWRVMAGGPPLLFHWPLTDTPSFVSYLPGGSRGFRGHISKKKNRFLFIQLIIQFYLCFIQEHDMEYSKLLLNFVECLEKLQSSNEKGV